MDLVLWPEHHKYAKILDKLTEEILTDLISKIHLVEEEVDETVIVGELPFIEDFPEARKPAYKPEIDFGELGKKRSSDQISQHYNKEDFVVAGKSSQLLISHTG